MKRWLVAALAALTLTVGLTGTARAEKDAGAAAQLSLLFPGAGEWYNSDYAGGFPFVECIAGAICPCIRFASVIDAADGKKDEGLRIDFWASPDKK